LRTSGGEGVAESVVQSAAPSLIVSGQQRIELLRKVPEWCVGHASGFDMLAGVSNGFPASLLEDISQKYEPPLIIKGTLTTRVRGQALPQRDHSLADDLYLTFKRRKIGRKHFYSLRLSFHCPVKQMALKTSDRIVQSASFLSLRESLDHFVEALAELFGPSAEAQPKIMNPKFRER